MQCDGVAREQGVPGRPDCVLPGPLGQATSQEDGADRGDAATAAQALPRPRPLLVWDTSLRRGRGVCGLSPRVLDASVRPTVNADPQPRAAGTPRPPPLSAERTAGPAPSHQVLPAGPAPVTCRRPRMHSALRFPSPRSVDSLGLCPASLGLPIVASLLCVLSRSSSPSSSPLFLFFSFL